MHDQDTFTRILSFEQAKKGERILTRLDDWLAETGLHEALSPFTREQLGTMLVSLRRSTRPVEDSRISCPSLYREKDIAETTPRRAASRSRA